MRPGVRGALPAAEICRVAPAPIGNGQRSARPDTRRGRPEKDKHVGPKLDGIRELVMNPPAHKPQSVPKFRWHLGCDVRTKLECVKPVQRFKQCAQTSSAACVSRFVLGKRRYACVYVSCSRLYARM